MSKWTLIGGGGFATPTRTTPGEGFTPFSEVPTGTVNGSNTVFTLSNAPLNNWLILMLNNTLQNPNVDYSLSGNQITYTVAPRAGDSQSAWYFA